MSAAGSPGALPVRGGAEGARLTVLMVTPHLPPHQAANALLPHLLSQGLARRGHETLFLTFGDDSPSERVTYVRRRPWLRVTRVPQALEAAQILWRGATPVDRADIVHIHSNTWMNQVAARLASLRRKPYVLTHYGTEIWHHDGRDPIFRALNAGAGHVAFYSRALLDRARELGIPMGRASVVYPPVSDAFRPLEPERREAVRSRFGVSGGPLLVNVKRLHPLADHATLLRAMRIVADADPRVRLLIAGSGEQEGALRAQANALNLGESVRFLGLLPNEQVAELQGAADLFVLSSLLEATPTVALEALASGTPVISTDSPGGLELHGLFGDDVAVVPREDASSLAAAISDFLGAPRRTVPASARLIEETFRLDGVVDHYLGLYRQALAP